MTTSSSAPTVTPAATGAAGADPVQWALVGYGFGGRVFHAPLICSTAGMTLSAVVTTDRDRRAQLHVDFPAVPAVDDLAALVELGVRGVTISTPPATHPSLAREALDLGLDVVVDKPFALTADDAAQLVARAGELGRLITAYQNRRWDNDFLTLRRLIDAGALGTVYRFTSRLDRFRPEVKAGWPSGSPADGAGTLLDLGPHLVDQAMLLFGPVASVHAELDTRRDGTGAEDDIELHLLHTCGVRSTLAAGLAAPAEGTRFLVNGSIGGVRIEGFDIQEAQLKAGNSPTSLGATWGVDPDRVALLTDASGTAELPLDRGCWDAYYPAVAAAVSGSGTLPVDPADPVATAAVLDAARRSAATGTVIHLRQDHAPGR